MNIHNLALKIAKKEADAFVDALKTTITWCEQSGFTKDDLEFAFDARDRYQKFKEQG